MKVDIILNMINEFELSSPYFPTPLECHFVLLKMKFLLLYFVSLRVYIIIPSKIFHSNLHCCLWGSLRYQGNKEITSRFANAVFV